MKAIIASIALLLAMVANAGPFGYEMGQKIEGEPDEQTDDGEYVRRIYHDVPPPFRAHVFDYTWFRGRGFFGNVRFHQLR